MEDEILESKLYELLEKIENGDLQDVCQDVKELGDAATTEQVARFASYFSDILRQADCEVAGE